MGKLWPLSTHAKGIILAVVAVLILTPDAVLVRELGTLPNFVVMFYRNLIFTVTVVAYEVLMYGPFSLIPKFQAIGIVGWIAGFIWGTANILITYGFQTTAVANVLVITACNPMFAALFSFIILKEKAPWYTILAGLVCFGAIISIFYTQLSGGGGSDVAGLLSALGAAVCMGLYFVLLRLVDTEVPGRHPDSLPCNIIAGLFATIVSLIVEQNQSVTSGMEWLYLLIDGVFVLALSFSLLNICPTMISATEVSLMMLIETVLGPVLVYAAGYEAPPNTAVYGGSALAFALIVHSYIALKMEKSSDYTSASAKATTNHPLPTAEEKKEKEDVTHELTLLSPKDAMVRHGESPFHESDTHPMV